MIKIKKTTDSNNIISKGWGEEIIIHNDNEYCGKLLRFIEGCKFSLHYHVKKSETWYVNKGEFILIYIDTNSAVKHELRIGVGDIIHIERNTPHQLMAITDGEIFEVSTPHFDDDSYRIEAGDSQIKNN